MSWNSLYTKRKQKEMAKKSASYQAETENDSYKYTEFSKPQTTTNWHEERAKERRIKVITTVMLSLMSVVFIAIIMYFATHDA